MQTSSSESKSALDDAAVEWLFPSPVMVYDWPGSDGINLALRQAVHARRSHTGGVVKTNRGGWQSEADLQDWGDAATASLMQRATALASTYVARQTGRRDAVFDAGWKIRAWANINEHGHFNRSHDHLGMHSFISGVYYVDVGDIASGAVGGGRTRLEDWSRVAIDVQPGADDCRRDRFIDPRDGRMLLFPASLMHSVEPYLGKAQRITIAFNLWHPALGVPRLAQHLQQADWWWTYFRGLVLLRRKLPEKALAATLVPGHWLRASGGPLRRLRLAWAHATALASERFDARRGGG